MRLTDKIKGTWTKKIVAGVVGVALLAGAPAVYAASTGTTYTGAVNTAVQTVLGTRPQDGTGMMYGKQNEVDRGGYGRGSGTGMNLPAPSELSEDEKADLLYMAEEEKVARDVYITLYDKWGEQVFQNISQSEQRHMDAIATLLDRYDIESPVINEVGKFTNPDLQALYDKLVAQGSQSVEEALKVGALIEEVDIKDLEEAIARTDNEDIKQVYENLKNGSYHHLKAFVTTLKKYGEEYSPQVLSEEEYQEIISMEIGRYGRGNGQGHGHGKGHGINGEGNMQGMGGMMQGNMQKGMHGGMGMGGNR